jgi:hypothetical protein
MNAPDAYGLAERDALVRSPLTELQDRPPFVTARRPGHTIDYLFGTPLLVDFLEEGWLNLSLPSGQRPGLAGHHHSPHRQASSSVTGSGVSVTKGPSR